MIDRVLRVEALIALDADADLTTLHRRDRTIGSTLAAPPSRPARRVLEWADAREDAAEADTADVGRAEHAALLLTVVLGLVFGAAAAAGVLWYDGAGRVNVLLALSLLVGLQVLTVILSLLLMLPPAWRGLVPGLGVVQSALESLSPGRLQRLVARWAPVAIRPAAERVVSRASAGERIYGRLRRWLTLLAGQVFGAAFNVGLVVSFLVAVVFTDLAFGWSTTLDVDPEGLHRMLAGLAGPWAAWLPDAVPSLELVQVSRYFRAGGSLASDPAILGRWWPYVLACVLTYAALPRLALLAVAALRARAALGWTLVHLPGARELLYRLDHDPVETRAETPESAPTPALAPDLAPGAGGVHGPATVVVWGDHEPDAAALAGVLERAAGLVPARVLRAGAGTLEDDAEAIRAAAAVDEAVALVVKSWEPPLGDLLDFVAELRAALGETRPIQVVPFAPRAGEAPAAADVKTWASQLARLGDPWLVVRAEAR